jgi:hypothetical protein
MLCARQSPPCRGTVMPDCGRVLLVMTSIMVILPAPLGPITARSSPPPSSCYDDISPCLPPPQFTAATSFSVVPARFTALLAPITAEPLTECHLGRPRHKILGSWLVPHIPWKSRYVIGSCRVGQQSPPLCQTRTGCSRIWSLSVSRAFRPRIASARHRRQQLEQGDIGRGSQRAPHGAERAHSAAGRT